MELQGLKVMIQKMVDSLVIPKFPEIYEIKIIYITIFKSAGNEILFVTFKIFVDGTDEEQEDEIRNSIYDVLEYTGFKFSFEVKWVIER